MGENLVTTAIVEIVVETLLAVTTPTANMEHLATITDAAAGVAKVIAAVIANAVVVVVELA